MVEKISNIPAIVFLLVGVAIAAMNFLGDKTQIQTLEDNAANLVSQIKEKEGNLKKAKNASQEVPVLKAEIEQLSQVVAKASELVPKNLSAREVIDVVSREAKFAGIRITQSRPLDISRNQSIQGLPGSVAAEGLATQDVVLELEIEGSYSQITFFFYQLTKSKVVIMANDFDISVKEILDSQANLKVKGTVAGVKYMGAAQ